ncbi:MAG: ABC transporter substrate-binding protein [Chloroflexota bacterium]|nr:ABC transporter substrate-binding protein [Chloroflexota bacterium]
MSERNYWQRMRRSRMSRRSLLRASARAGVGAAGMALVGCGGDDDDDGQPAAAQTQQQAEQQQQAAEQQAMQQEQQEQTQQEQQEQQEQQQQAAVAQAQQQQQAQAAQATGGPRPGGTVRAHSHADPATSGVGWDPQQVTSGHAWHHHSNIFDRMLGFDDSAAVRPELASALEIPDDVTYLFTMRDGAIFQDGAPVDANAVQLNMERIQATEATGLVAAGIGKAATMEATDDRTWRMVNSEPFGPTVSYFQAYPGTSLLISPQNFDDVATNPVGAGAMKLVEEVPGERWIGERWDGYWDSENVHIDRYELHVFTDENTALNAFLNGDLDFTPPPPGGIPADFQAELEADGHKVVKGMHQIWDNTWFNLNPAAEGYNTFRDPRMRHAYNRAIDRDALNVAAFDGADKPSRAPTSTESWAVPGDKSYYPGHDKHMAHELMDAAGYGDGVTGIQLSYGEERFRTTTEPINSQVREVGIDLQYIAGTWAEIVPRFVPELHVEGGGSGDWTIATITWEAPFDPHPVLGQKFEFLLGGMYGATDGSGTGPADLSQNPNDEVLAELHRTQELVWEAAKPATQEDRIPLYAKVWEAFEENMLVVYTLQWPSAYATQGHLEGFEIIPFFGLPRGSGSKYVWLNNV